MRLVVPNAAPVGMNGWGYADLLAKVTAGADWILADALGVEAIDTLAWDIVQGGLREATAEPRRGSVSHQTACRTERGVPLPRGTKAQSVAPECGEFPSISLPFALATAFNKLLLILFPKVPHPVFDVFDRSVALLCFGAGNQLFVQEAVELMTFQRLHAAASRVAIDTIVGRDDAQALSRSRSFHLLADQIICSPPWTGKY